MTKKASKKVEPKVETHVTMYRGDKTANVHVDEVVNYQSGGWSKSK